MPAWINRLRTKWGIESAWQITAILLAFSLAGMSILFIRPMYWGFLGFTEDTSMWIQVPVWLILVFPTYQVMLLVFGTLLGQFRFFWNKFQATGRFFARPFRK